jgi:hypothetical protein
MIFVSSIPKEGAFRRKIHNDSQITVENGVQMFSSVQSQYVNQMANNNNRFRRNICGLYNLNHCGFYGEKLPPLGWRRQKSSIT